MNCTRFLPAALACAVSLLAASCATPPPTEVEAEPTPGLLGPLGGAVGLLQCDPLPYDSVTRTIGPDGGVLLVGPHRLSIPPGALDSPVAITAVTPSESVNRVAFQPEGLVFTESARLTLSYANCDLLGSLLPKRIAYVTGDLGILEYLLSLDDLASRTVTGRLDHFSSYAVAW